MSDGLPQAGLPDSVTPSNHEQREAVPPEPPVPATASIRIVAKHPLAIRWMHWINFPILFTMVLSGLWIYWADSIPYVGHIGEVYRVGWGHHTLVRLFPSGFWDAIDGKFKL
ncbi:MAG: thiosulfate reductase, partial [Acidobacteriaceae bacterium]